MKLETVFIAFGSNTGDRQEYCDRAVTLMGLLPDSQVRQVSSYYETRPVDPEGILGDTWFYNGVVKIETSLSCTRLAEICTETERALGRDDANRAGPRTMDFDILFYGQHVINQPNLIVPHPRLHVRRFVLQPLAEIDPQWIHPTFRQSVQSLLEHLDDSYEVQKLSVLPGSRYGKRPACSPPNFGS